MLEKLLSGSLATPIEAIGNILDKLFTSDDERLGKRAILERLSQQPIIAQQEINKIEAQHRSIFVAGWRPFIGWVCGFGIAMHVIARPFFESFGIHIPPIDIGTLHSIITAMLGLGGYRTVEKFGGKTK